MSQISSRYSRPNVHFVFLGMLLLATLLLAPVSSASAEVTKLYSASHSLTGDCLTTTADPVPDPGCPGGAHPAEGALSWPKSVATDSFGDVYVVNGDESEGRGNYHVDIFDPQGHYISTVPVKWAQNVAVDSKGNLYVGASGEEYSTRLLRYEPTTYDPQAGEIAYGSPPVVVADFATPWFAGSRSQLGMVIDQTNDHLYLPAGSVEDEGQNYRTVVELAAAVEGVPNELVADDIGAGSLTTVDSVWNSLALDATRHRLYVPDYLGSLGDNSDETVIKVLDTRPPYDLVATIKGSETPLKKFVSSSAHIMLAADEESGHLFVVDVEARKVYEFDDAGKYVGALQGPKVEVDFATMTVDNWPASSNRGYLYVPSGTTGPEAHLFAYEPKVQPKPPVVESLAVRGVTEDEAVLSAKINPKGEAAHYVFEFAPEQAFEEREFEGAVVAGEGDLIASGEGSAVAAAATGLAPGTTYRFRVRAENQCKAGGCAVEQVGSFTTYALYAQSGSCPNEALRSGPSASLADCRAYELVTPSDTGGFSPASPVFSGTKYNSWPTPPASLDGSSFAYTILGGLIPGIEGGNAGFNGTNYRARREASGWHNESIEPSAAQASRTEQGGLSTDHEYFALIATGDGSMVRGARGSTTYVRYPDGSFRLAGTGSLAEDPLVEVLYIPAGGAHVIFEGVSFFDHPPLQLESGAPPDGTIAIYDRTPDGLHVVSLLPGEETPGAGQNAVYVGASADGSAIAWKIEKGSPLYLRLDNAETVIAAPLGATFAGLSADGQFLFYRLGGDLYRFDSTNAETDRITDTGDALPVNISSAGTGVYFLSGEALPTAPNPNGSEPQEGGRNLYYWDGGSTRFVATVTERDVTGTALNGGTLTDGLGLWLRAMEAGISTSIDPSRTTPDGSVLLFESRADLTDFSADGKAEVYRYDATTATLACVSCNPTGRAPDSDSWLLIPPGDTNGGTRPGLLTVYNFVPNLSRNGSRAFFETSERLVAADTDQVSDVYEWEAEGEGTCAQRDGCLFLISSGRSAGDNYLFGASETGSDVFISTNDQLVPQDLGGARSVYDARVDGGFPPPPSAAGECLGEACQPPAVVPDYPTPASATSKGRGNAVAKGKHCRRGKPPARKEGKKRCVAKHQKHHGKRRAHPNRRTH